ncbi:MAG: carboxypeptidase-like regulatory domain-containing protein [Vicinamibacteraceae bacterium]
MDHRTLLPRALIVGCVTAATGIASLGAQRTHGVVTDPGGRPLAGVTISTPVEAIAETAADGSFPLSPTWTMARFTADGYLPRIRFSDELVDEAVVMMPTSERARRLPRCSASEPANGFGMLGVPTPDDVRRTVHNADHAVSVEWRRGGASLWHNSGSVMTSSLPPEIAISGLQDVRDRDVRLPDDVGQDLRARLITDYRGRRPDGNRYRFVGRLGEFYEYDGVSPTAAHFFDRMLDALCYAEPAAPAPIEN